MAVTKPDEKSPEPEDQKKDEGKKDEGIQIPKERLDKESAKRKAAEEKAAAAEAELAKLRGELEKKDSKEPEAKVPEDLVERLAAMEKRDALRDLRGELGVTQKQAEAVHEMMSKNTDLTAAEAMAIARARDAELFGSADQRGADQSQHTTLRAGGGRQPPKPMSLSEAVDEVNKLPTRLEKDREHARLLGIVAAKTLGWARKEE